MLAFWLDRMVIYLFAIHKPPNGANIWHTMIISPSEDSFNIFISLAFFKYLEY